MASKHSLLLLSSLGAGLLFSQAAIAGETTENPADRLVHITSSADTSETASPTLLPAEAAEGDLPDLELSEARATNLGPLGNEQALEESRAFVEDLLKSAVDSERSERGAGELEGESRGAVVPLEPEQSGFPTVLKLGRLQNDIQELQNSPATLYSYEIGEQEAVTVYFDGLPLLTFVANSNSSDTDPSPLERATQLTAQLNLLAQQNLDGVEIDLATDDGYAIAVDGQVLVAVDESIVLDRPGDYAGTATAAVNQLRHLLQGAPPLNSTNGFPAAGAIATSFSGIQRGLASWYGPGFAGRRSANGEIFDPEQLTAAHRYLPFGTLVQVTNMSTGGSVVVRINDRGPFIHNRVIDLSAAAARTIGLMGAGVGPVELRILNP